MCFICNICAISCIEGLINKDRKITLDFRVILLYIATNLKYQNTIDFPLYVKEKTKKLLS